MTAQPQACDSPAALTALSEELLTSRRAIDDATRQLSQVKEELARTRQALAASRVRENKAWDVAHRDALTGLPNRYGFESHSRRALSAHEEGFHVFALLFLDLDGFKAVNDRLGHGAGDELLRIVGSRLAQAVRSTDLISRYGGDEFLCLLPHLQSELRATTIARTLISAVATPCLLGAHTVSVRPSVGVALYPRDGRTIRALVRSADHAMFHAKTQGLGVAMAASSPGG